MRRRPHATTAYTLIELLIVIAVIAMLMSLFFPALSRAREHARTAACLSNLRQIGVAVTLYAHDHDGATVPFGLVALGTPTTFRESWASILIHHGYLSAPEQPNPAGRASSGDSVLRCPSGLDAKWVEGTPAFVSGQFSPIGAKFWRHTSAQTAKTYDLWYGANAIIAGPLVGKFPMNCWPTPGGGPNHLTHLLTLPRPDQLALLYDGMFQHTGTGWGFTHINARHNRAKDTNILFVDGHCQTLPRSTLPSLPNQMLTPDTLNDQSPFPQWRLDQ